ncbi:large ribosomal subunit protein uL14mz isoform X2 [Rhododendron vialii]|uniref:large ribosomal subunit protein uL14mz isoform X2 n=1 Tax=Rhododendron vialii TaxID=182163 RepID=UPI00265E631D|nr:large ribosomal subunit protein uL14mz isoform X2 [Rhododendron vialii]
MTSMAHLTSKVGRSLFSSLNINALRLGSQSTSPEITCSSILSQQQRTFIQMRTKLKVVDNSGAKEIMCIQALKGGKKGARLGDLIVASVKEFQQPGKAKKGDVKVKESQPAGKGKKGEGKKAELKKGSVVYAVVVRAAMQRGRCDGSEVKFDDNAAVLVNKQGEPIGSRVFGPIPHELRKKKHVKILSLAEHIV